MLVLWLLPATHRKVHGRQHLCLSLVGNWCLCNNYFASVPRGIHVCLSFCDMKVLLCKAIFDCFSACIRQFHSINIANCTWQSYDSSLTYWPSQNNMTVPLFLFYLLLGLNIQAPQIKIDLPANVSDLFLLSQVRSTPGGLEVQKRWHIARAHLIVLA